MSKESNPMGCTASKKERRKWCDVDDATQNYEECVTKRQCPNANYKVNLGQPGLRGGIETSDDSAQWRHWKKVFGIAHGDD